MVQYKCLFDREKEVLRNYIKENEIEMCESEIGLGEFSGLGEGKYYLKESKALTGFCFSNEEELV